MKNRKNALLWKIEHHQKEGTSYVFGTMHVQNAGIINHYDEVFSRILSCDSFACEYNLDQSPMISSPESFYIPNNQTIRDFIPKKRYEKLCRILKKSTGFDLDKVNRLKPLFVTNLISGLIIQKDMPFALDEFLWNFAKQNDRQMKGIETMEEQLEIMEKLSLEYQIKSLLSIGKNISTFRKSLGKMTELYMEGDAQKLFKATKKGTGKVRKLLLYNRNEIMANRIDEFAKQETLFAAIGAGHLGGKKGVLRLLKKKGWKVKSL
jgi:uncharacterized protein YbaP (TraB family)